LCAGYRSDSGKQAGILPVVIQPGTGIKRQPANGQMGLVAKESTGGGAVYLLHSVDHQYSNRLSANTICKEPTDRLQRRQAGDDRFEQRSFATLRCPEKRPF